MINKGDKIYKLNNDTIDSLNRFLKSNNIITYIISITLNLFWLIGKIIKKLLKKDKIEQVIEQEITEPVNKVSFNLLGLNKLFEIYKNKKQCILYIDLKKEDSDISGALDYSLKKKEEFYSDNYNVIDFQYIRQSSNWLIVLDKDNVIYLDSFLDISTIFDNFNISKIFVNNLLYCTKPDEVIKNILDLKNKYMFTIEYAYHDYLSICPSYFLINKQGLPCDIVDDEKCNECLLNNPYRSLIINDIKKWRNSFLELFKECDKIWVFSNFTKSIIINVFEGIENKIEIVHHKPLLDTKCTRYIKPKKDDELRIGFVGNFHHVKGADFYIDLINKLKENGYKVKPIVIGYKQENEYKDLDYYFSGPYKRNELGKILTDNKIDFVVYSSINSETFSYIVQELMLLNVPIVLFRRGAPAERIEDQNYNMAEIALEVNLDSLFEATVRLINKL